MLRGWGLLIFSVILILLPVAARADGDDASQGNAVAAGLQPLTPPIIPTWAPPGESQIFRRPDGAYQAIPYVQGKTKTFRIFEREAPWTLRPGLTVMAKTYNGVVPGPTIVVNQGDHVVIDVTNELNIPDTLHLHGIHGTDVSMDGIAGISQQMIPPNGGHYRYEFDADQSGTFMYHTHGNETMLDSGLYGGIIVEPAHLRPEEVVAHDYLQVISSWQIQSLDENHFTINGKSYPATQALDVSPGQRIRIRWINISGDNVHTMHTHGHDQLVIARDAQPLEYKDLEDTVFLGPGQRVDVLVNANAKPGTWLVHCHVLDHIEDAKSMPDGLITALHYVGTPNVLTAMNKAMLGTVASMSSMNKPKAMPVAQAKPPKGIELGTTLVLAAVTGLALLLGLPFTGSRQLSRETNLGINVTAIALLGYLIVQIANEVAYPIRHALGAWSTGAPFPLPFILAVVLGLLVGLVGLGTTASRATKHDAGARTLAEGLAIGASAVSGAVILTIMLVIVFALYNAVKGFRIAALLSRSTNAPNWKNLGLAGVTGFVPVLLGTIVAHVMAAPECAMLFLSIGAGTFIYVIGELATETLVILRCGNAKGGLQS